MRAGPAQARAEHPRYRGDCRNVRSRFDRGKARVYSNAGRPAPTLAKLHAANPLLIDGFAAAGAARAAAAVQVKAAVLCAIGTGRQTVHIGKEAEHLGALHAGQAALFFCRPYGSCLATVSSCTRHGSVAGAVSTVSICYRW